MNRLRTFGRRLLLLGGLLGASTLAAEPNWRRPEVSLQANGEPAAALLQRFAAEQGIPLEAQVPETAPVSGDFRGLSPRAFLDAVCDASQLAWFWDGARLYVDPDNLHQTRTLEYDAVAPQTAAALFEQLGFASGPAQRQHDVRGGPGLITLIGSPRFHQVAEPILRALNAQESTRRVEAAAAAAERAAASRESGEQIQVRVFRLKYASAGDLTVYGGGSQSVIPGVARALQNLMGSTAKGDLSTGVFATPRARMRAGLLGTGLAAVGQPVPSIAGAPIASPTAAPGAGGELVESDKALIQADPRLNAVIVRDIAARMPIYEQLIRDLDVASPVIEISAAVVDIDATNGQSLGVEFLSFGDGNSSTIGRIGFEADREFNRTDGDRGGTPRFTDGPDLVRGPGFLSSALVPVNGYELLVRVRALEEKGAAQLVTSPSVITLENVEASLRQDETVYIRVAGNEATDLFDVQAGVHLRVTPTLVQEGDQTMFRLVVNVQDGSFSDILVDGVPTTRESAINTQAVVPADKTLLIGGYFVERQANNARQVPVLGNVPVLGRLFKRTENTHARAQRYFFITPRLVDIHAEARQNRPPSAPHPSRLPAESTDPDQVTERAHELAARGLPVTAVAAPSTSPLSSHDG